MTSSTSAVNTAGPLSCPDCSADKRAALSQSLGNTQRRHSLKEELLLCVGGAGGGDIARDSSMEEDGEASVTFIQESMAASMLQGSLLESLHQSKVGSCS